MNISKHHAALLFVSLDLIRSESRTCRYRELSSEVTVRRSIRWVLEQVTIVGLRHVANRVEGFARLEKYPKGIVSTSVYVAFTILGTSAELREFEDLRVAVWTTTPWTMPTNMAVAVNLQLEYSVAEGAGDGGSGLGESIVAIGLVNTVEVSDHTITQSYILLFGFVFGGGKAEVVPQNQYFFFCPKHS